MRNVILMLFGVYILNNSIQSYYYGRRWMEASKLAITDPLKAVSQYDELSKQLHSNRSFILNVGSIYYQGKQYEKCIKHYEEFKHLFNSSDMYLMLGDSYENTYNFKKAEENYRNASNLIPHLFVPRYRLFKLYQKNGENEKALAEAKAISKLNIKVYSDIVKNIKTEANEYLYKNNQY